MPNRKHGGRWLWSVSAVVAAWMLMAGTVFAETKSPFKLAVQTTIGNSDAPVRAAVLTSSDREQLKFQPIAWYGGRAWYGYRPYYSNYRPYYSYYRAPYYTYFPAPYYNYYPYYAAPYYTYYTPPTYYVSPNFYVYPYPYYTYRVPARRVFVARGYYW